ncbi:hypothetical protein ACFSTE_02525 [Aquimarina hainanensis]|uniref:Uncharacterized protein n=2 Tax=Aquimarina hainanensis TaxID=1578017 RepID=A0ABW5N264_9FLAO
MKNQTQITETKKILIAILMVIGAVIIFTAPLLHIVFPKKPEYQVNFEDKINKFNKIKDAELCDLKEKQLKGIITPLEYIEQAESFQVDRETQTALLNYQLKNLINDNRIFGFKNMRIFLIGFGIRLPYIFFSTIILFFFLYSRDKLKSNIYLYHSVRILYTISFLISFYMTIWFLLPRDLPVTLYHLLIGTLSVLSTISSILIIKYYYNKKSNFIILAHKVKELIHFITKSRRTTLDLAITASHANPKLKNDISSKLVEYDKELNETMKRIIDEVKEVKN